MNYNVRNMYEIMEKEVGKKSPTQWLKELNEIGLISSEKCKQFVNRWKLFIPYAHQIVVMCDVAKIDANWKNERDLYISSNIYELLNLEKYVKSRKKLINDKDVDSPPIIGFNDDQICFEIGRHRFSNLRDCGQLCIPLIIDKDDLPSIQNYLYI